MTPEARMAQAIREAGINHRELTDNARAVLQRRYLGKDREGNVLENPEAMFLRVAKNLSQAELEYGASEEERQVTEDEFNHVMSRLEFLPNSPTLMNAGRELQQLSACFVLPVEDSLDSIFDAVRKTALIHKSGGGTGFSFSKLRPKGDVVGSTGGVASGPVSFITAFDAATEVVKQGSTRRGANMAILNVDHPDILEFIRVKRDPEKLVNFNVSVGASHEFMEAVRDGTDYPLRAKENPSDDDSPIVEVGRLDAREVFAKIIHGAWRNGEPGMIFLDWVNHKNPTPHIGRMTATNPCGEQPLLPYESCNLGSINLANFVVGGRVDYERLRGVVHTTTRFLDNVIDANSYSVDKIEEMTRMTRKVGLGVMGFADMLIKMRVAYDSEEGLELGRDVMRFIRDEADAMSEELTERRGVFPGFKGSIYDAPGQPKMRNACRLTVAPTGTISMIAGCSSGIEPLFALSYHKHNILGGESLIYVDEQFEEAAREGGFYSDDLMEFLASGGSLRERDDVPDWAKQLFVTAADISPEMHVRMQAAFQESVDAAISKTINFPNSATEDDVERAYLLAWELGCKGITVYRAGSREAEVLTAGQEQATGEAEDEQSGTGRTLLIERQRPSRIEGITERVRTGHGNMFVTINYDENEEPFEVFIAVGKAGGCDSAQLEGISRLTTLALRAGIDPTQVVKHLQGITCCPAWDGGTLVRSAPDGLALVLKRNLKLDDEVLPASEEARSTQPGMVLTVDKPANGHVSANGSRCPECSVGTLVYQEGCKRCPECGYNKCE